MTVGPWKPISVHAYTARIADLRSVIDVKEDLSVHATVSFEIEGVTDSLTATFDLLDANGKKVRGDTVVIQGSNGTVSFEGKPGTFDLWYPVGYGKQALYTIQVTVVDEVGFVISTTYEACLKLLLLAR